MMLVILLIVCLSTVDCVHCRELARRTLQKDPIKSQLKQSLDNMDTFLRHVQQKLDDSRILLNHIDDGAGASPPSTRAYPRSLDDLISPHARDTHSGPPTPGRKSDIEISSDFVRRDSEVHMIHVSKVPVRSGGEHSLVSATGKYWSRNMTTIAQTVQRAQSTRTRNKDIRKATSAWMRAHATSAAQWSWSEPRLEDVMPDAAPDYPQVFRRAPSQAPTHHCDAGADSKHACNGKRLNVAAETTLAGQRAGQRGSEARARHLAHPQTFTDFLHMLLNIFNDYDDAHLIKLFAIINDEARKYHYKGCKFHELLDNYDLRKFISRKLTQMRNSRPQSVRRLLSQITNKLNDTSYSRTTRATASTPRSQTSTTTD
ncbi:uncharacterized protein LOC142981293 [Anticarsia gemmatalis]|uniref:uncharacterized protein LOC142981293 n=1 Tax=Anticarsia gemmatalis TaxID=129554 RepID=UPI003F758EE9